MGIVGIVCRRFVLNVRQGLIGTGIEIAKYVTNLRINDNRRDFNLLPFLNCGKISSRNILKRLQLSWQSSGLLILGSRVRIPQGAPQLHFTVLFDTHVSRFSKRSHEVIQQSPYELSRNCLQGSKWGEYRFHLLLLVVSLKSPQIASYEFQTIPVTQLPSALS